MTSPQKAASFLSRAVGPGTSSKTISLSASTSFPQYILLLLHSERLLCGNRRPRQKGWSSVTHSALDGEDSMLWDVDNLFQETSKCLRPGRCTAGESACRAKHWPPAGKLLSYSGSIQNWSRPNCMYNVGCWAVKTGCLSGQCWEKDMICPHPLKAYYGKGQRALKRLSNEGCLCVVNGFHPARLQTRCIQSVLTGFCASYRPVYRVRHIPLLSVESAGWWPNALEQGAAPSIMSIEWPWRGMLRGAIMQSRLRVPFLLLIWAAQGGCMQGLIGGWLESKAAF